MQHIRGICNMKCNTETALKNKKPRITEPPQNIRAAQKRGSEQEILSFKRRYSCFALDSLMVIEINELINKLSVQLDGGNVLSVNTLCLKNGEKVFRYRVVIAVPTP